MVIVTAMKVALVSRVGLERRAINPSALTIVLDTEFALALGFANAKHLTVARTARLMNLQNPAFAMDIVW